MRTQCSRQLLFFSPDNNNVRKLKDRNQNGELSGEDGNDVRDVKDVKETLALRITELKAPQVHFLEMALVANKLKCTFLPGQVSDVESRSVTVSWEPVETATAEANESDDPAALPGVSYEASVALKSARGNQDKASTYRGKECHFRLGHVLRAQFRELLSYEK